MELLLTPLVNKFLSRFIKSADGTSGSQLRVSLSGGSVVLHHLELNLESVLGELPITVHRAFARQLKLNIAWTALASQPIQVILDTVEVVVALNERSFANSQDMARSGEVEEAAGSSWMGSFTSLLLHALFNVSVIVNNVVVKYLAPTAVASLTCQSIHLRTASDGWQADLAEQQVSYPFYRSHTISASILPEKPQHVLQKPDSWLKKMLEVQKAAVWLDERQGDSRVESGQLALLRLPRLCAAALLPLFAVIEGTPEALLGQEMRAVVEVDLEPVESAASARQIEWLRTFVAKLLQLQVADAGQSKAEAAQPRGLSGNQLPKLPVSQGPPADRRIERVAQEIYGASGGASWLNSGLAGAAGRAWSYITDEAAMLDAASLRLPIARPFMAITLKLHLRGGMLWVLGAGRKEENDPKHANYGGEKSPGGASPMSADPSASSPQGLYPSQLELENLKAGAIQESLAELRNRADAASTPGAPTAGLDVLPSAATPTWLQSAPLGSAGSELLASIKWQSLQTELDFGKTGISSLDFSVVQISVCRHVKEDDQLADLGPVTPFTLAQDEVLGLYAASEIDSSALRCELDSARLAAHLQWRAVAGQQGQTESLTVSLGRVSVVYAAGFAADVKQFIDLSTPSDAGVRSHPREEAAATASAAAAATLRPEGAATSGPTSFATMQDRLPLLWLKSGHVMSFSVLSLHAAAASARSSIAEAVLVSMGRVSAHLGSVKPATRPGSVTAALYSLRDVSLPGRGLRIALARLQAGVATRWMPSAARDEGRLPACVQEISDAVEIQLLLTAADEAQTTAQPGLWLSSRSGGLETLCDPITGASLGASSGTVSQSHGCIVSAVVSRISISMSGDQLAAVAAVASSISAEAARKLKEQLPPRSFSPTQSPALGGVAALANASLEIAGLSAVFASKETEDLQIAAESYLTPPSGGPIKLLLGAPELRLGIITGEPGRPDEAAVSLSLTNPLMWAVPNVGLYVPTAEVALGKQRQKREPRAPQSSPQSGSSLVSSIGSLLSHGWVQTQTTAGSFSPASSVVAVRVQGASCISLAELQAEVKSAHQSIEGLQAEAALEEAAGDGLPVQIFIAVSTVSTEAAFQQWEALVVLCTAFSVLPALPQLPGYPPADLCTTSKPVHVHLSLESLTAQIMGAATLAGAALSVTINDLTLATEQWSCWEQGALVDANGYPTGISNSAKFVSLSVDDINCGITHVGLADDVERHLLSFLPSTDARSKAVILTVRSNASGSMPALATVVLETRPVHACLSCGAIAEITAFVLKSASAARRARLAVAENVQQVDAELSASVSQGGRAKLRVSIPGISADVTGTNRSSNQLVLHVVDAVLVINDGESRSMPRTGNLSLQGARLTLLGTGLPEGGAHVFRHLDVHMAIKTIQGQLPSTALIADMPVLAAQLSPRMLSAAHGLMSAYSQAVSDATGVVPAPASRSKASAALMVAGQPADDLRCGLFELASITASRPGCLQISFGDKQPGMLPWSGGGESWVCWRYPHPRLVAAVLISLPLELLGSDNLELLAFSAEADSFVPVHTETAEIRRESGFLPHGLAAGILLTVKGDEVAAEEWQLCWEGSASAPDCRAAKVLQQVFVNPRTGSPLARGIPPALPVPLTVGLSAQHLKLQLLLDQQDPVAQDGYPFRELAAATVRDLQIAAHIWENALALRSLGALQLTYNDDTAMAEEILLEPSLYSFCFQRASAKNAQGEFAKLPVLHLESSRADLSLPFPMPPAGHQDLSVRFTGRPFVLRLSELGLHALLHLSRTLPTAVKLSSTEAAPSTVHPRTSILLENKTPLALEVGQVGCGDRVPLPAYASISYVWAAPGGSSASARCLLQVQGAIPEEQPDREENGWVISDAAEAASLLKERQTSHASTSMSDARVTGNGVGQTKGLGWSGAIDIMSAGMCVQAIPVSRNSRAVLAVHVHKLDALWHTIILPGCSLVNCSTQPLQICLLSMASRELAPLAQTLSSSMPQDKADPAQQSGSQRPQEYEKSRSSGGEAVCMELQPDSGDCVAPSRVLTFVSTAVSGPPLPLSSVRVWLGAGNGWSHFIPLQATADKVMTITAAGFGGLAPSAPAGTAAFQPDPGLLYAQLCTSEAELTLTIWPPLLLLNEMPCSVTWRLQRPYAGQVVQVRTLPGAEAPLNTTGDASQSLSLKLDQGRPEGSLDCKVESSAEKTAESEALLHSGLSQAQQSAAALQQDLKEASGGWSRALLTGRRSGSYGWGLSSAAEASLPDAGQRKTVEVGYKGRSLAVELAAEAVAPGLPCIRLKVLPSAVVQSCINDLVTLECTGGMSASISPMMEQPVDWRPLRQRPRRAILSHMTADGFRCVSVPFALEPGDTLLALRVPAGSTPSDLEQPVLYLAARVEIQQHPVPSSAPALETVYITITPGCFLSNLTKWPLTIQPTGTFSPVQSFQMTQDQSIAAPFLWRDASQYACQKAKHLSQSASDSSSINRTGALVSIYDPGGSVRTSGSLTETAGSLGGQDDMITSDRGCIRQGSAGPSVQASGDAGNAIFVCLTAPQARQRLHLRTTGRATEMVTFRVVASRGHLHAVFFRDCQPPVLLQNCSQVDLEIGLFLPEVNKLREVQHETASSIFFVEAGCSCECDLRTSFEADNWDEQEDEDSFLDWVTGERSKPAGYLGKLRLRRAGSSAWSDTWSPQQGSHMLGDLEVSVFESCASLHCCIQQAGQQATRPWPNASPLTITVDCQDMQVCLFDDSRRKWHGEVQAASESQPVGQLFAELFCISVGDLQLQWEQQSSPGGRPHWNTVYKSTVSAQTFQIDWYSEDSSHAVLCSTVAGRGQKLQGIEEAAPFAPLLLEAQVVHDPTTGSSAAKSFRNTWVRSLGVRLPTLALAVDDAFAAFVERAAALMAVPPPPPLNIPVPATAGKYTHSPVAPRLPVRSGSLISPTRGNYFDLTHLDSLDAGPRLASLASMSPQFGSPLGYSPPSFRRQSQQGFPSPSAQSQTGKLPSAATLEQQEDQNSRPYAPPTARPGEQADPEDRAAHSVPADSHEDCQTAMPALAALSAELSAEAISASASRLRLDCLSLGRISLLLDVHLSQGSHRIPVTIDTHRTPVSLPAINATGLLFRPSIMLQGLLAHYAAEAVLNAPAVLGSLDLLLNPTGLFHSVGQGFEDLVALPLAALEARSPSQFVMGLGMGSASLVRHLSGWTLTSISGFSSAFSRVLQRSLSAQSAARRVPQQHGGQGGLSGGLHGLAGGVSSGFTGLYRSPLAGYGSSGSGLAVGLGRGLLGAVGLPISGALDLVSSISQGIAMSTGVTHTARLRRPGRRLGEVKAALGGATFRLYALRQCEQYAAHCIAEQVTILSQAANPAEQIQEPALLLTHSRLILLREGGLRPVLSLCLAGLEVSAQGHLRRLTVAGISPRGRRIEQVKIQIVLDRVAWQLWMPFLKALLDGRNRDRARNT